MNKEINDRRTHKRRSQLNQIIVPLYQSNYAPVRGGPQINRQ